MYCNTKIKLVILLLVQVLILSSCIKAANVEVLYTIEKSIEFEELNSSGRPEEYFLEYLMYELSKTLDINSATIYTNDSIEVVISSDISESDEKSYVAYIKEVIHFTGAFSESEEVEVLLITSTR